eukprot:3576465-Amphidinium_carterae.1
MYVIIHVGTVWSFTQQSRTLKFAQVFQHNSDEVVQGNRNDYSANTSEDSKLSNMDLQKHRPYNSNKQDCMLHP